MKTAVFLIMIVARMMVYSLTVLMLVRAVMSWIAFDEDNKLSNFVYNVTEPVIYPFRVVFDRCPLAQGVPLDIPYFTASITLLLIDLALELIPV